jgi:trigger factor
MNVKNIEKNGNQATITVEIDKELMESGVQKAYLKARKNIMIPGFRKGKAPRKMIEAMYGAHVFFEDGLEEIFPEIYEEAVVKQDVKAIGRPSLTDMQISDDNIVTITISTETYPEVTLGDYKGLEVEKAEVSISDEQVQAELDRMAQNVSSTESVERAAEMGDTANIDFEGFDNGVAFDGGKGEGFDLKLGSGQFIPGFEDQIVGHAIGDAFDVNVTFPTEYHAEELAGKAAVFQVKLNALKVNELPALVDEFVRDVSEFDTLDEYKADIKAKLEEKNAKMADNAVEDQLLEALMGKLEAEIPEAMFDTETENFVRDYDNRLRMQGLDLATYFKYTGMNLDMMRQQLRPQAEKQVKTRLALEKIAELENIAVSDEEIEAEYGRIAEAYGMEIEKVKETVETDALAADMKVKKAVDLVKEKAVVTDAAPAADAE